LDIDVVVASEIKDLGQQISILVRYWNRRYNKFQPDSLNLEEIVIKKEDFRNWYLI
jgi:hypothetical protein